MNNNRVRLLSLVLSVVLLASALTCCSPKQTETETKEYTGAPREADVYKMEQTVSFVITQASGKTSEITQDRFCGSVKERGLIRTFEESVEYDYYGNKFSSSTVYTDGVLYVSDTSGKFRSAETAEDFTAYIEEELDNVFVGIEVSDFKDAELKENEDGTMSFTGTVLAEQSAGKIVSDTERILKFITEGYPGQLEQFSYSLKMTKDKYLLEEKISGKYQLEGFGAESVSFSIESKYSNLNVAFLAKAPDDPEEYTEVFSITKGKIIDDAFSAIELSGKGIIEETYTIKTGESEYYLTSKYDYSVKDEDNVIVTVDEEYRQSDKEGVAYDGKTHMDFYDGNLIVTEPDGTIDKYDYSDSDMYSQMLTVIYYGYVDPYDMEKITVTKKENETHIGFSFTVERLITILENLISEYSDEEVKEISESSFELVADKNGMICETHYVIKGVGETGETLEYILDITNTRKDS